MAIITIPNLRTQVNTYVAANGVEAITGPILNGVLINIIDSLEYISELELQSLQDVLEVGASGNVIAPINIISTDNGFTAGSNNVNYQTRFKTTTTSTLMEFFNLATGDKKSINISISGMVVLDESGLKGLVYAADYSAQFTDRSLIDKGYLDTIIAGLPVDQNGIYTGSGALVANTVVTMGPYTMQFTGTNNSINLNPTYASYNWTDSTNIASIILGDSGATLQWDNGANAQGIVLDGLSMYVQDTINNKGLVYDADYSANFTLRSLVDKAYVDSKTTLYSGSGSLSGNTTVNQGTNILVFSTTIPLASPAAWFETFRINATNNEPTAYLKGLYVSTTGANGHVGQFQNLTSSNNVILSTPSNAIEATGTTYIMGKDNLWNTNGLLITNQDGYTGTWAFKNNGNIAQRHEVPVAGNNGWNYAYSLVSVNNCPTDFNGAMNISVSGPNSYAAFFGNATSSTAIELCAPGHAIFSRLGTKGLMVGIGGWGSVINHASYSLTGGQVYMGSDTVSIMTYGNGTTSGTYNLWLRNSAATTLMIVTDDGLLNLVKGGHTITLNANGTSTMTEIDTTNIGHMMKSADGYLRIGRTGSAGPALIYVGDSSQSLQLSGTTSGTPHIHINSAGQVGIGTTSVNSSAILEIASTTMGFLPPVMTGAEAEAIASPANGLIVYATGAGAGDITTAGWWGWRGANWFQLG